MEGKGWLLLPSPAPAWAAEAGQLHAEVSPIFPDQCEQRVKRERVRRGVRGKRPLSPPPTLCMKSERSLKARGGRGDGGG